MAFRILNNYEADVALTNLNRNKRKLSKLEQQLATGLRIVRAADDATDLFIADNLKQTYVGLERGTQNAQYGLAFARTADDAIGRIGDILVKIKDKIVEAANAHTTDERIQAQQQINEYVRNIAQIVQQTEFDGFKPLAGDPYIVQYGSHKNQYLAINGTKTDTETFFAKGDGLALSAKANSVASGEANLRFVIPNYSAIADKEGGYEGITDTAYYIQLQQVTLTISVITFSNAEKSLGELEAFMASVGKWRGYYAGVENKLQNIIENNQVMVDNLKEGESLVRNVDYASAFAEFQRMQVITQANVAALSQANQIPQLVQQLLR